MANIIIYIPEQDPIKLDLGENQELTVGRGPDNDIVVDHESISTQHALLRRTGDDGHILIDQGSTNGIYLENNPVPEAPLSHGATFHIGHVPAQYEAEGQQLQPAAASAGTAIGETVTGLGAPTAQIPETSVKPAGFKNLSPIKKVEKENDSLTNLAKLAGWIAIATAAILVIASFLM